MDLGVISYPAIVIICWLIGYAVKQTAIDNKWIPVIVGVAGAIIGLIAFKTVPVFPAEDWLTALVIGIVSGETATGVDQVYKQFNEG